MSILQNIKFAVFVTLLFVIPDQIFKFFNENISTMFETENHKQIFWLFVISFVFSFAKSKKVLTTILLIIVSITYFQMVHFLFYATWIEPLEVYLFFMHLNETFTTLVTRPDIFVLPSLLYILSLVMLFFIISKSHTKTLKAKYFSLVIVLIFTIGPIQSYINTSSRNFKFDVSAMIVSNSIKAYNTFFARIIPNKLFGITDPKLDQKIKEAIEIDDFSSQDINIVLILGESLRYDHMSLYGYKKETTPYLNSLLNDKNFLYKKAISASVFTYVSISSLINCIDRPNGLPIVIQKKTCLISLAKKREYATSFISSQSRDGMSNIRNSLCQDSLDLYKDAYSKNNDNYTNEKDIYLFNELKKLNLDKKNFIILHQIGSHSPYKSAYSREFAKFKENNTINEYDNTIVYSDYIYQRIINYLKENSKKPTIIIFTSDHAESLGENGVYGHGNIRIPIQHKVPFFIYAINMDIPLRNELNKKSVITHYQVSKYIAHILGYKIDNEKVFSNKEIILNGKDLTGLDGFIKVQIDE
jgi:glucan phosphoethanolaminetransferase (alkaline phosphatase superfamily)